MLRNALCFAVTLLLISSTAIAQQNIVVVLDDSGSMSGSRMTNAKYALIQVINSLSDDTQFAVYALNSGWIYPDHQGAISQIDKKLASDAVNSVYPSGGTPLGAAIKIGGDSLLRLRKTHHYGTYRLIVVTDGEANDGALAYKYLPDIARRNITVDLIGLDMSGRHSLAAAINGNYKEADDAQSLAKAVQDVLAESSGSSGDAKESDYELLEGIPTEFASAALLSLAKTDDTTPIGDKPIVQVKLNEEGHVVMDENGNVATEPFRVEGGDGEGFSAFIVVVGTLVLIAMIGLVAMNSGRRRY